jgi:hypothetical protein
MIYYVLREKKAGWYDDGSHGLVHNVLDAYAYDSIEDARERRGSYDDEIVEVEMTIDERVVG